MGNNTASEINAIVDQIILKYHPKKIILFGSGAEAGGSKPNDLDFLIIKDDVPHLGTDRIRELDELIDRETAADLLVYRSDEFEERLALKDPFILRIMNEGRVLYG